MKNLINVIIFIVLLFNLTIYSKSYKGAELRTKQSFLYGRFEVKMKSAFREGMLSSFFTYYDGGGGLPTWNEIDIEILGRYPNDIQFNTITPGQTNHVSHYPLPFSPHEDFHVYAFEWTPEYVAWFVDSVEVYRQTGSHIQTLVRAQKLMMNIWNPEAENWAGKFNPDALPAFAYYDWVKYYKYTPGTGNYGTGNNFTFSWMDEFNFWDTARWDKASHTWVGNGCDFIYENAVFSNGMLILCLTDSVNIGYNDNKPPILLSAKVHNGKVFVNFSEELDPISSQNKSNFFIYGVTIDSARLLNDKKTVELTVSNWDFISPKTLVVMNVYDDWVPANKMNPKAVNIITQTQFNFPLKINCGGNESLGYLADQEWTITSDYGYLDGVSSTFSFPINNTDEDSIFQSERWGATLYRIRLPNGIYDVKLLFAENYFNTSGERIFDVWIEQEKILDNLDIYATVGRNTALIIRKENVVINDGFLDIYFSAEVNHSTINGIIVDLISLGLNNFNHNLLKDFVLHQNFPNPFNGETIINYSINRPDFYSLRLFDIVGRKLIEKKLGYLSSGEYHLKLDFKKELSSKISSGVYFYSLENSNKTDIKKMILLN